MQHRQASRILREIAHDRRAAAKIRAEAAELATANLPKLGPYRRYSPESLLWKLSSDSTLPPRQRLKLVRRLIIATLEKQCEQR